ncbi:MAG: hypothetical protein AB7R55_15200 [Gemmatimonadales bacterium]
MRYQPGASLPASFDPPAGAGTALDGLLGDLDRYLADRPGLRFLGRRTLSGAGPDVEFGCELDPSGECLPWEPGHPSHRLAVTRASSTWIASLDSLMAADEVDHLILLTLEVGQYHPRQRDLLGRKSVELGRDHAVSVPWLTSLETPVSVLQLTGALIDRSGRAVRIGAEGILARRTSLPASSIGLQRLLTEEEVDAARATRREDLRGQPPVWLAATEELLDLLLGGRP